jgi:hypothetical protein
VALVFAPGRRWRPAVDPGFELIPGPGSVRWVEIVAEFRPDGAGHVLLDADGHVVARLTPRDKPRATPGPWTAEERTDRVARLRAGLVPADREGLTGRSVRPRGSEAPQTELRGDGSWHGSDGRLGSHGRWVVGPDGSFARGGKETGRPRRASA